MCSGRGRSTWYYHNQGGWEYYIWGGVYRICFVFTDSLEVGGYVDVGNGEGYIEEVDAAGLAEDLPTKYFAGIVCVAN